MPYVDSCIWNIMFLSVSVASVSQADTVKGSSLLWACETIKIMLYSTCAVYVFVLYTVLRQSASLCEAVLLMHTVCFSTGRIHNAAHRMAAGFIPHSCHQQVITLTHKNTKGSYNKVEKGRGIIFFMRPASAGLLSIPGLALPASPCFFGNLSGSKHALKGSYLLSGQELHAPR